jgi:hypothetical protein
MLYMVRLERRAGGRIVVESMVGGLQHRYCRCAGSATANADARSIGMNLDHIPDFAHLIDTPGNRLSNLLEVEGWEHAC